MTPPSLTITNEQINSLPLLLGIIDDMGIRTLLDTHVTPHGVWQGASVGPVISIWLSHVLLERDHRLSPVRTWAAERAQTLNALLSITLRDTDCTDDRLANILTMVGNPETQAALDVAMLQQWVRIYRVPTDTLRLESTSVSVSHEPPDPDSLLQHGHRKDHRPDLRQCKAMLATLDPLGLPRVCQPVAGHRADDGWYVPAYQAAVTALGTSQVLVVGESKMGALDPRGHIVGGQSCSLCAYRPPSATAEIAAWRETALTHAAHWQRMETGDRTTGAITTEAVIDEWTREQTWTDTATQTAHPWTERVLVVRSAAYQAGLRRRRARALTRVTAALVALWHPAGRGRKRSHSRAALERTIAERVAQAGLPGVVQATGEEETLPDGTTRWIVAAIWVHLTAWQALLERVGWQVDVTNTTPTP